MSSILSNLGENARDAVAVVREFGRGFGQGFSAASSVAFRAYVLDRALQSKVIECATPARGSAAFKAGRAVGEAIGTVTVLNSTGVALGTYGMMSPASRPDTAKPGTPASKGIEGGFRF